MHQVVQASDMRMLLQVSQKKQRNTESDQRAGRRQREGVRARQTVNFKNFFFCLFHFPSPIFFFFLFFLFLLFSFLGYGSLPSSLYAAVSHQTARLRVRSLLPLQRGQPPDGQTAGPFPPPFTPQPATRRPGHGLPSLRPFPCSQPPDGQATLLPSPLPSRTSPPAPLPPVRPRPAPSRSQAHPQSPVFCLVVLFLVVFCLLR